MEHGMEWKGENVWYGRANSTSFRNLASSAPSPIVVPMHSSVCIATLVLAATLSFATLVVEARPTFVQRIPNGASVPGVRALGHLNPNGGGTYNAFGEAFEAAGTQWTTAICQADTDGDGATNGEELGDPCCTWRVGGAVNRSSSITHPGVANAFSANALAAMRCEAAAATVTDNSKPQGQQGAEPAITNAPVAPVASGEGTQTLPPVTPATITSSPRPTREQEQPSTLAPTSGTRALRSVSFAAMLVVAGVAVWADDL